MGVLHCLSLSELLPRLSLRKMKANNYVHSPFYLI